MACSPKDKEELTVRARRCFFPLPRTNGAEKKVAAAVAVVAVLSMLMAYGWLIPKGWMKIMIEIMDRTVANNRNDPLRQITVIARIMRHSIQHCYCAQMNIYVACFRFLLGSQFMIVVSHNLILILILKLINNRNVRKKPRQVRCRTKPESFSRIDFEFENSE